MVREFTLTNFDKGLNLREDPTMIQDKQFSELRNLIVDEGLLKVRECNTLTNIIPNYYSYINGLYEYIDTLDGGNAQTMLVAHTNMLCGYIDNKESDVTKTWQEIAVGQNQDNPINFAKFSDGRVYFVDGVNPVKSIYNNGQYVISDTVSVDTGNWHLTECKYFKIGSDFYIFGYNTTTKKLERWKWVTDKYQHESDISGAVATVYVGLCYDVATDSYIAYNNSSSKIEIWQYISSTWTKTEITTTLNAFDTNIKMSTNTDGTLLYMIYRYTTSGIRVKYVNISTSTFYTVKDYSTLSTDYSIKIYLDNIYINTGGFIYKIDIPSWFMICPGNYFDILSDTIYTSNGSSVYSYSLDGIMLSTTDINLSHIPQVNCGENYYSSTMIYTNSSLVPQRLSSTNYTNSKVREYIELSTITDTLTVTPDTGTNFRAGTWYFFYQILKNFDGDQRFTNIIGATSQTFATTQSVTFTPGYVLSTGDIFVFYARHETEIQFYEVGRTTASTLEVAGELNPIVFFEERDIYNPPPAGCHLVTSYRDMMWFAKNDTLYVSNYNQAMNVPRIIMTETGDFMGGVYPVGNDKIKISAIYEHNGYLFVYKENNSVYRIAGDPGDLSTFRIDRMGSVGAKNQRCVCNDGTNIYVYNSNGIYVMNEQGLGDCISDEINDGIVYANVTSLCYHNKLKRLLLLNNDNTAWCFNMKNKTWSDFDNFTTGIPIQLSYLGNDLHIESSKLYKSLDCVLATALQMSFKTKLFNFPSPALYKQFHDVFIYCDGNPGISFVTLNGNTKSKIILNGVAQPDTSTQVSPGSYISRQRVRNRAQKCYNYALHLIFLAMSNNTFKHSISSITFHVNEKGGMGAKLPVDTVEWNDTGVYVDENQWEENV